MVRGRKAKCTVQRSILSPGTAKLRRVLRTKQPKHNESEALPASETAELELGQLSKFTSALRRAMEIWLTAIKGAAVCLLQARCDGRSKSREPQPSGGRNFCPAYAGRNGFPLERVVFRHEGQAPKPVPFLPAWVEFPPRSPRLTDCQPWLLAKCRAF